MRFLASSHQLHQLTPRTLLLLVLLLAGFALQGLTGVLMHHLGPGWTPSDIAAHYRGDEADAPLAPDAAGELPPLRLGKSFAQLVETAHFHLLAMPLAVFVVAHLFSMAPWGRTRWAGALCVGTFACAFVDVAAPFLVKHVGAGWAWAKLAAFIGLEAGYLGMTLATLVGAALTLARRRRNGEPAA